MVSEEVKSSPGLHEDWQHHSRSVPPDSRTRAHPGTGAGAQTQTGSPGSSEPRPAAAGTRHRDTQGHAGMLGSKGQSPRRAGRAGVTPLHADKHCWYPLQVRICAWRPIEHKAALRKARVLTPLQCPGSLSLMKGLMTVGLISAT